MKTQSEKALSNKHIDAFIPTKSQRPQAWYDFVNVLVDSGFIWNHDTAEWVHPDGKRGRICFTDNRAWLRHPDNSVNHHPEERGQK